MIRHFKDDELIKESRKDNDCCPVCDNKRGFVFGTCIECGFNYLDASFHYIKVDVDYLPQKLKAALIREHASRYNVETDVLED